MVEHNTSRVPQLVSHAAGRSLLAWGGMWETPCYKLLLREMSWFAPS
jgi:hypothetical protein